MTGISDYLSRSHKAKTRFNYKHTNQVPKRMYQKKRVERIVPDIPTEEELDNLLLPECMRKPVSELEVKGREHLKGLELEGKHRYGDDYDILKQSFTRTPQEVAHESFKLLHECRKLYKCIHLSLNGVPKHEKYVLGMYIRESMYKLLKECVFVKRKYYRRNILESIDIELEVLRVYYHIAYEQYPEWISNTILENIYKQINVVAAINGGLLKTTVT